MKNQNLSDKNIKKLLIQYTKKYIPKINISYDIEPNLNKIKDKYILYPMINNDDIIFVCTKFNNNYYMICFDKSYNIYPVSKLSASKRTYKGTILRANIKDNIIIINDVYLLANQKLNYNKIYKIQYLDSYIRSNFIQSEVKLHTIQYFTFTKYNLTNIYDYIINNNIKEIIFTSLEDYDIDYYYIIQDSDLIKEEIKIANFLMTKGNKAEIYHLSNDELKCIAYIPTLALSKEIKTWFDKKNITVKCKYDEKKDKWIPVEKINN